LSNQMEKFGPIKRRLAPRILSHDHDSRQFGMTEPRVMIRCTDSLLTV
jgi:hypothetical protein